MPLLSPPRTLTRCPGLLFPFGAIIVNGDLLAIWKNEGQLTPAEICYLDQVCPKPAVPGELVAHGLLTHPEVCGREDMDEMTSAELNQYLENIAKLIESSVEDTKAAEQAAKIVRDSKVKA